MPRNPSEEVKYQFENKLWIGRTIGIHNFDGHELTPRLMLIVITGAVEQIMHVHGLLECWPNIPFVCNSLVIYCLVIQLVTRLASKLILREEEHMMKLLKTVIAFYEREELIHSHRPILTENLKVLEYLMNAYLTYNCVLFCMLNPTAWCLSWYCEKFVLFTPIYLPILDPYTLNGYIISSVLLLYYTALVYFCFMADDIVFIYFLYQCVPMVDIYCLKLREFSDELMRIKDRKVGSGSSEKQPRKVKKAWEQMEEEFEEGEKELSELLKEIVSCDELNQPSTSKTAIKKSQKELENEKAEEIEKVEHRLIELIKEFNVFNDYVKTSTGFMTFTTYMAITLNSTSIAMALVGMLYYSYVLGIVGILVLFAQVFTPCVEGTLILRQKEKLFKELISFPYFELTVPKQKMFLNFIHMVQNSNDFRVPIVGQLSMEVFTGVMNGARAFFMYLLNFVKI